MNEKTEHLMKDWQAFYASFQKLPVGDLSPDWQEFCQDWGETFGMVNEEFEVMSMTDEEINNYDEED